MATSGQFSYINSPNPVLAHPTDGISNQIQILDSEILVNRQKNEMIVQKVSVRELLR